MADRNPDEDTAKIARPDVFEADKTDSGLIKTTIEKATKKEGEKYMWNAATARPDFFEEDIFYSGLVKATTEKAAKKEGEKYMWNAVTAADEAPTESATAALSMSAENEPVRRSESITQLAPTPPPPDAQRSSKWAPWFKLTEWEMAELRKRMIKNGTWKPSLTMVKRELERLRRTHEDYAAEKARCEAAGEDFLDE